MNDSLTTALARSGTTPDYTMGAVTRETGILPETLRSWERRYGYPAPARTPSNQRLYSARDITGIMWILEQTRAGQSVSQAIGLLQRALSALASSETAASPPADLTSPQDALIEALAHGDLATAHTRWDDLALGLSPDAIGRALLAAHHALTLSPESPHRDPAHAFLHRKAMVLLDAAQPDIGDPLVAIVTTGSPGADLPAAVIASALARAGIRLRIPFATIASLPDIGAIRASGAQLAVMIDVPKRDADILRSLLADIPLYPWNSSTDPIDQAVAAVTSR